MFLILYEAGRKVAYWLYVQNYFEADLSRRPARATRTVRVVIPVANVVDVGFVRYARDRKLDVLGQLAGKITHHA